MYKMNGVGWFVDLKNEGVVIGEEGWEEDDGFV